MSEAKKSLSISTILKIFATILTIAVTVYTLDAYIDKKIEKKIESKEFLQRIAYHIRPTVIVNLRGAVVMDMGGLQYIESIKVEDIQQYHKYRLIVTPKHYLAHAPLVSTMGSIEYSIQSSRGKKLDWEYILVRIRWTSVEGTPPESAEDSKFRIEIFQ